MVREKQRMVQRAAKSELPWSRLVWGGGSTQSLGALVSEATLLTGTDQRFKYVLSSSFILLNLKKNLNFHRVYPLLPMALEEANAGDFVFLSSEYSYTVTGSAGLESGGSLRGTTVYLSKFNCLMIINILGLGKEMSKVSGCEAGDVMLDINCGQLDSSDMEQEDSISSRGVNFALSIANVTLEAYNMEMCLLVNAGDVLLENCLVRFYFNATGIYIILN